MIIRLNKLRKEKRNRRRDFIKVRNQRVYKTNDIKRSKPEAYSNETALLYAAKTYF
jgi:hypothetical protein